MTPIGPADTRPRLLIVDDEPRNLRLLADIFADEHRLSLATSGQKALELLDLIPDIDLVLLDVMMPGIDGLTVFDNIRALPSRRELPVIFVTARHDAAIEMKALEAGGADYLHKPVHVGLARTRVRQQLTLARQRVELQRAREAAEAGSRAKSQFLTSISHELRTPLNAILGFSQVLASDEELNTAQRGHVREIREAGEHLLSLINDVLDLGKIEASRMELDLQAVDLGDLAASCLRMVEPLAQRRGIELHLATEAGMPRALADPMRVRQVVVNLLSNAVKFNRTGGRVDLKLDLSPEGWPRVEVRDNGPGIEAELMPYLFEPFRRGLEGQRRQIEGTGIGLTICKRLVEMMKGRLECSSVPGEGARFWFVLPQVGGDGRVPGPAAGSGVVKSVVAEAGAVALPLQAAGLAASEAPEAEGLAIRATRVLCIDDNPANLKLLQIVLKRLPGVTVIASLDPREAVPLAAQHRPDLVLVDIQMPDVDGYEVLRRLRALRPLDRTPVAALSANAMPEDISLGLQSGFADYFTKPFDVPSLLAAVQRLLKRPVGNP